MNRRISVLLLAVLLLAAIVPATAAYAKSEPTTLGAEAFFDTQQSTIRPGDPCVRTRVQINAEENYAAGDPPINQVELRITEFDDCIVDDFGLVAEWYSITVVPDNALMINPNLRNAHLHATLTACNLVDSSDCRTLDVNAHWKGDGDFDQNGGSLLREARAWGKVIDLTHDLNLATRDAVIAFLTRFDAP